MSVASTEPAVFLALVVIWQPATTKLPGGTFQLRSTVSLPVSARPKVNLPILAPDPVTPPSASDAAGARSGAAKNQKARAATRRVTIGLRAVRGNVGSLGSLAPEASVAIILRRWPDELNRDASARRSLPVPACLDELLGPTGYFTSCSASKSTRDESFRRPPLRARRGAPPARRARGRRSRARARRQGAGRPCTGSPSWRAPPATCRSSTGRSTLSSTSSCTRATSFIALYDEERQLINWPYYVDEFDNDVPDPNRWDAVRQRRGARPDRVCAPDRKATAPFGRADRELSETGEIDLIGALREDWLGVPLNSDDGRTVGVLAVQSYLPTFSYTEQDEELLAFVGQHVGVALSRARAIEETRQRNAELALINSVQEALAGELELQAIYDAVGEQDPRRVRRTGRRHRDLRRGLRAAPLPLHDRTRRALPGRADRADRLSQARDGDARAADDRGEHARGGRALRQPGVLSGELLKSALFVPLVVGERATGVISLQNIDREHAFTESDQQLLETLDGQFQRRARERAARARDAAAERGARADQQRSGVDRGRARPCRRSTTSVGDRIRDVFDAQVVDIAMLDETSGLLHFPYLFERGERWPAEPVAPIGFPSTCWRRVSRCSSPRTSMPRPSGTEAGSLAAVRCRSLVVFAPLVAGGRATGVISLQNIDREHAFSDPTSSS